MASAVESAVLESAIVSEKEETELKKGGAVVEDESKENKEEAVQTPVESKEEEVKEEEKKEVEEPEKEEVKEEIKEEVKDAEGEDKEEDNAEDKSTNGEKRSSEHFATDTPGKRIRKSVEHFVSSTIEPSRAEKEVVVEGSGRGCTLADIPWVNELLDKHTCEKLKPLHKLLFNNTVGNKAGIKQRIRKFNGYSFNAEDQKHATILARMKKMPAQERKDIMKIMGLNMTSTIAELMEFLMEPQDKGKKTPKKPTKATPKKRKSDSSSTPRAAKKQKKQIYSDSEISDSDDETAPPKKSKISVTKKSSPKSKSSVVPSDMVLTSKVKEVVGELDLDTITMKQAVAKVAEAYPEVDLTERKTLIKEVIKNMLD